MVRQRNRAIGNWGEQIAADFLANKDYKIIERNYRWSRGEIDIIAEHDDTLVFVEVKTAATSTFGDPEAWVDERKQRRIGQVAEGYLLEHEIDDMDCRFDVIAIRKFGNGYDVRHIENAFWLDE